LAIVLSVLRYTDSDCPFGIFKLFSFAFNFEASRHLRGLSQEIVNTHQERLKIYTTW